ncbi:MAG TPA: fibronectin type III domain-containing protein [Terriglobia bacterium]|nr:fibronectin type III domain-containing protein [Terriglobia bacterium]
MSLKVFQNYGKAADADLLALGLSIVSKMTNNPHFVNPPVDLAALKLDLETFSNAIVESLDGSKKVMADKAKLQQTIVKRLRLLGHYVEANSNDDVAVVTSSGFQPATVTRGAPQPLATPDIRKIDHGVSGQLLVMIDGVARARSYEVRYATITGGTIGSWAIQATATVKSATPVNDLTPGTMYTFQVRALGRLGFTDWSDAVNCICT